MEENKIEISVTAAAYASLFVRQEQFHSEKTKRLLREGSRSSAGIAKQYVPRKRSVSTKLTKRCHSIRHSPQRNSGSLQESTIHPFWCSSWPRAALAVTSLTSP